MLYFAGDWGRELSSWGSSGGLQGPGVLEEPMAGSAEGEEQDQRGLERVEGGRLGRAMPATGQGPEEPWAEGTLELSHLPCVAVGQSLQLSIVANCKCRRDCAWHLVSVSPQLITSCRPLPVTAL